MMHPDDERELMDEISGFTRWDDNNERYGPSAIDYADYDEEDDGPNMVAYPHEDEHLVIADEEEMPF